MSLRDSRSVEPLVEPLTRREREVLGLLAQGLTASEIAEKLTLAASSVKWHVQQLYGKLGVNNKQRALLRAAALGLIAPQPSAPVETPQRRSDPRHNLPLQFTRFFGRETELVQLKARLAEHRLVTLVGSGGVGKTRLALRAAEDLVDDFANGVWFVGLASLSDPALAVQTVTTSLGLRDEPGRPIIETVIDFLRPRQVLVVLDNCEHLLEACAQVADQLLRACPRLTILASSREPLGVEGEAVFTVPSLPFPAAGARPEAARLTEYEAVRLFTDRARLVAPEFAVTPGNALAVARICQRLDGIPLALEMAAARLSAFSAEQLANRLDDAFRLLTGNNRTALPRQQTLRATLDWSYKLLTGEQRLLLQRLSVFAGGCTLEAAEEVCSGEGLERGQVVEVLAALVSKSLVIADRRPGAEPRYYLLETVRQYAREKLQEAGEGDRLRTRHRNYMLILADATAGANFAGDWLMRSLQLSVELDNLRPAMEWSSNDTTVVDALPRLVFGSLSVIPSMAEQLDWCERGVRWCRTHPGVSPRLLAVLLARSAPILAMDDPQLAIAWLHEAIELSRNGGRAESDLLGISLFHLINVCLDMDGVSDAMAHVTELQSLVATRQPEASLRRSDLWAGAPSWLEAHLQMVLASLAIKQGRYQEAIVLAGNLIPHFEDRRLFISAAGAQSVLGQAHYALEHYEVARNEFLRHFNMVSHHPGYTKHTSMAHACFWLAKAEVRLGNLGAAVDYCRDSLRRADKIPDRNIIAGNLGQLAIISAHLGQATRAARLSGASAAMWARQKRKPWDDTSLDTLLPGWREGPEHGAISSAYEAGLALTYDEAVAYALSDD